MRSNQVIKAVCDWYDVSLEQLRRGYHEGGDKRELINARWAAMHLLEDRCELTRVQIGKLLNRDHSTVTYGMNQVRYRSDKDEQLAKDIKAVDALLDATEYQRLKQKLESRI